MTRQTLRHWTDTSCTCGLVKSKTKGAHHDIFCERAIAREEQRQALLAKTTQKHENKKKARSKS